MVATDPVRDHRANAARKCRRTSRKSASAVRELPLNQGEALGVILEDGFYWGVEFDFAQWLAQEVADHSHATGVGELYYHYDVGAGGF